MIGSFESPFKAPAPITFAKHIGVYDDLKDFIKPNNLGFINADTALITPKSFQDDETQTSRKAKFKSQNHPTNPKMTLSNCT